VSLFLCRCVVVRTETEKLRKILEQKLAHLQPENKKKEEKDKTVNDMVVVVYKGVHYKFKNIHIYVPVCVSTYFTQQNNLFSSLF
jgi:hypothetical protein